MRIFWIKSKTPVSPSSHLPDRRETLEGGTPSLLHVWVPCVSPLGASSHCEELCADRIHANPPSGALTRTSQPPPVMVNMNGPSHTGNFSMDQRGKAQSPCVAKVSNELKSARHINTVTGKTLLCTTGRKHNPGPEGFPVKTEDR